MILAALILAAIGLTGSAVSLTISVIKQSKGIRMTETGLGWPDREAYNTHANVKLTEEQIRYIENSGESTSQWIREAVEERITRETHEHP